MYILVLFSILGLLYFNKDFSKYVLYKMIQLYTIIELNIFNNIRIIRAYLNQGLKIDYVYYYTNNEMIQIDKNKRYEYIEKIEDNDCIYIIYRFDNIKYIDIISNYNKSEYNTSSSLKSIKDDYYKGVVCACSVTISDDNIIIYDEMDITDIFISLLHNSLNSKLYMIHIKNYIFDYLNIKDNYDFKLTFIDKDCDIYKLNLSNYININSLTEEYNLYIN